MIGRKGKARIDKVVEGFDKQVEELELGISEVQTDMSKNDEVIAKAQQKGKELTSSKKQAESIKENINKFLNP